jgi:hypothetical protein
MRKVTTLSSTFFTMNFVIGIFRNSLVYTKIYFLFCFIWAIIMTYCLLEVEDD